MAEKEKINPVTLDIVKDSLIAVSNEIFYAFAQTSMKHWIMPAVLQMLKVDCLPREMVLPDLSV